MVVRKRKKSRKLRGRTRTMGYGRIGQHRKSGSRGGYGAAGMHKHKWSWVVKHAPSWFGKHGFTRHPSIVEQQFAINLQELKERVDELKSRGPLKEENGTIVIDLTRLGYTKLLGRGNIDFKAKIIVREASRKAIEKVREAGGEVIVMSSKSNE
uniref:Large ribosomal subunit protein uL15 n=1 Tax=Fervidicoccus fontis TaxID=683846 RepID=A0A7J3ZKN9_9CREN